MNSRVRECGTIPSPFRRGLECGLYFYSVIPALRIIQDKLRWGASFRKMVENCRVDSPPVEERCHPSSGSG